MSRCAQTRTILTRTSQLRRAASLLPASTAPELEPCNSPSIPPSPKDRFFAWQGVEDDGKRTAWFTHSLLLQPGQWQASTSGPTAVRLHRHPERHGVLHASVSVKHHPSSYFPCSPSVTRFGAYPAPCGTARLCFFGFQKIFVQRTQKDFPNLPKKTRLRHLGAGHTRVASRKSVPRVIRANTTRRKSHGTLHERHNSEGLPG